MKGGWVYFMSNGPSGTIYTGVTAHLSERVTQHKNGTGSDFCRQYGLTRLIYCEWHDDIEAAIVREKQIKNWRRAWKLNLVGRTNPEWRDLYNEING